MATTRQIKAVKNMVENGGIASRAMRDADYSPKTAKNPDKLTDSKGFQELLDEYLPDSLLTSKHRQLLESQRVISANVFPDGKDGKPINDFIEVPDNQTQAKVLELGYKIRKHLVERHEVGGVDGAPIRLVFEQ